MRTKKAVDTSEMIVREINDVKVFFDSRNHKYYVQNGQGLKSLPSVTTVTKILDKPMLVNWACKIAREQLLSHLEDGTEITEERVKEACSAHRVESAKAAELGSNVHTLIHQHIQGYDSTPTSEMKLAFQNYLKFEREYKPEYLCSEKIVYNPELGYAGTVDAVAIIEGVKTVIDFKTSGAVYPEYGLQLAGYFLALVAEGEEVQERMVVRVGKTEHDVDYEVVRYGKESITGFRAALYLAKHMEDEFGRY